MASVWKLYVKVLERHPWKTQAATTGVLFCAGDAIAQLAIEQKRLRQFDVVRNGRFTFFGLFIAGPSLRTWYLCLEKIFGASGRVTVLKKVFCDQVFFAPFFLFGFLGIMGCLQREPLYLIKERYKQQYVVILLNNYKLWPATQIINFYIVPFQHRILVVNCVALGWNTYLAWKANHKLES